MAPELYPIWGGGGTYAINLLQNLPRDVEVEVLASQREVPEDKTNAAQELSQIGLGDNINVRILSSGKDTFFSHSTFQYKCYKWIPKLNKDLHFDIIHGQTQPMPDVLLRLLNKKFNYVTTTHETFSRRNDAIKSTNIGFAGFESSEKYMLMLSPFFRYIEKTYIKRCHAFISPSKWMKNILHEDFNVNPSNVQVVYNGVDHRRFRPGVKTSDFIDKIYDRAAGPIVLYSGRMISTKGIHVLVKAIPDVIREIPDAHFVFTGGGNSTPYRQMIEKMNIPSKNYNFVGYIPDFNDLPGLYSIASVFAAPTLYENFPFRVLENMSCENPVVASNIVGIPEMITDGFNGLLVPSSDFKKLAQQIITVLDDQSLAKKLGQNARKTIEEQFTFQHFAEQTKQAYEWAVNQSA